MLVSSARMCGKVMFFSQGFQSRLATALYMPVRTATKRASGGKSANNNTAGRRLGPKKGEGEFVKPGQIIWRQRGTVWYPGENVGIGRDHTIYAAEPGYVRFYRDPFHAKRRFIGVALGKNDRLPTPHFEPRRRRFGYQKITNGEVAEFEKAYVTRKEAERLVVRPEIISQRAQKRAARVAELRETLVSLVPGLDEAVYDIQADRFDRIHQFVLGGMPFADARATVDKFTLQDLKTDLRVGRLSDQSYDKAVNIAQEMGSKVDTAVVLSPQGTLVRFVPAEDFEKVKQAKVREIETLTKDVDPILGTPAQIKEQIQAVLSDPIFTAREVSALTKQFILRPRPVRLTRELRGDYEPLVKKGEGKFMTVWDDEHHKMREYYVPQNAILLF